MRNRLVHWFGAVASVALLGTGGLTVAASQDAVAAGSPPDLIVEKAAVQSPVQGAFRTTIGWTISWSCASIESPCNNATLTDSLPIGVSLKTVTTAGGLVSGATVSGNSVTWHLETPGTPGVLDAGAVGTLTITGAAPCNATSDQTFSNKATMNASNATGPTTSGASVITVTKATTCDPPPPPPPSKSSPSRLNAGGRMPFFLTLPYAPSQYDLVDPVPAGLEFQKVTVGAPATVKVSCNGGSSYVAVDFASAGPVGACTKTGTTWNVSQVKFSVPSQIDIGWVDDQNYVSATITTKVPASAAVGTTFTNTTATAGPVSTPLTAGGKVVGPGPFPKIDKSRHVTPGEAIPDWFGDDTHPVVDGDMGYQIAFGNHGNNGTAGAPLVDPTIVDLLDPNLQFVPGTSWWRIAWIDNETNLSNSGCNTPTFEQVANWNGTGRTLLRWKFVGCIFNVADDDPVIHIFVDLKATPGLTAGTQIDNGADVLGNGSLQPGTCDSGQYPDTNDLDGDGNTTESLCSDKTTDSWIVPKLATIDSSKWVNGAADPIGTWTRFPTVGNTAVDADGYAAYHLFLEMTGNVVSDRIELVDILPHLGDTSTLNKNALRKSDWAMELVGPVKVDTIDRTAATSGLSAKDQPLALWQPTSAGYTAKYSTSDNPCRLTADTFGRLHIDGMSKPTGCTSDPWTLTDPAGAKSFALDIDANQEGYLPATRHGDLLRITVKVKDINEPPTAADLNKVAWNSFAYTVTDTDAFGFLSAEPIKVGVRMRTLPPTTASLGNYVWWDEDHNGTQNALEEGINGVTVHLYDAGGNLVQSTVTGPNPDAPNNDGYYRFYGLDPNTTYTVKLNNAADSSSGGPLAGMVLTGTDASGDDTTDNDATLMSGVPTIASAPTAAGGSYVPTYDFGFYKAPLYSLGNRVWFDGDNSGDMTGDGSTPGAGGVVVKLLDSSGNPVLNAGSPVTTTTDSNGYYRFDNLVGGGYIVEVAASNFATGAVLQGRIPSTGSAQNADADSNIDADDNGLDTLVAGAIRSGVVTLGPVYPIEPTSEGDKPLGDGGPDKRGNMTVDFGVYTPRYAVGNYVWFDADRNGLQNEANPIQGTSVDLYRADGVFVANTTTNASGKYIFDNLLGGDYYAVFTPPTDYRLTVTTGADAELNSNPNQVTRRTPVFTLDQTLPLVNGTDPSGLIGTRIDRTIDAGLIPAYTLGNLVWDDFNNNGIADDGEAPIANVTVDLYLDADNNGVPDTATPFATTTTGSNGKYLFTNLDPGKFIVQIPATQTVLSGLKTSGTPNSAASDRIDNDNNGVPVLAAGNITGWRSGTVTLGPIGTEPTNEVGGLEVGNPLEDTDTARNDMGDWTIDFGFHRGVRIGNQVWLDGVAGQAGYDDGVFASDGSEPGISGVTVELWQDDGNGIFNPLLDTKVDTTPTNTQGNYWFEHRTPGEKVFVAIQVLPTTGDRSSTGISTAPNAGDNTDDGAPVAGYMSVSNLITVPALGASPTGESDAAPLPAISAETEADAATHVYPDVNSDLRIDFSFVQIPLYRIGNLVWNDVNKDGIASNGEVGLGGVTVELYNGSGTFITSIPTDSSGHYLFSNLIAGDYEVRIPKAQAALTGFFTSPIDEANANLDGDNNDNGSLSGTFFTAGKVSVGDGNLINEPTNETLRSDVATDDDLGVGIIGDNHGNLSVDFGFYQPKFSIGNEVWIDKNDSGVRDSGEAYVVDGVKVNLLDSSGAVIANTTTVNGRYLFSNLLVGSYSVELDASNFAAGALLDGWRSSTPSYPENAVDGDDNGAVVAGGAVRSPLFTLSEGTEPTAENPDNDPVTPDGNENLTVDFGVFRPTMSLGNEVWYDLNNDGVRDVTEPIIADGTSVRLYNQAGTLLTTTTTTGGLYLFDNLIVGKYYVEVTIPSGYRSSTPTTTGDIDGRDHGVDATIAGGAHVVRSGIVMLMEGGAPTGELPDNDAVTPDKNENLTIDLGIVPTFSIGNEIWFDINNDGVKQATESYVPNGVKVTLLDSSGAVVAHATTTAGLYLFDGLLAGTYTVELDAVNFASGSLLEHWVSSTGQTTADTDQADHGAPHTSGSIRSAAVVLSLGGEPTTENPDNDPVTANGNENLTVDFGLTRLALGNRVFLDTVVEDGIQGPGEPGVAGVILELWASDGTGVSGTSPIATTTTDLNGFYLFDGLIAGDYVVRIPASQFSSGKPLAGYISTEGNGTMAPDPDVNAADLDDNGSQNEIIGLADSKPISLAAGTEPITEADVPGGYSQGNLDANTNLTVDFGFVIGPPLSLGNRVWLDSNNNGLMDGAEAGITGVTVELYLDANADGVPDSATALATQTTDANGYYLFDSLPVATYLVKIPKANFATGGPLAHLRSSDGVTAANDNVDKDDSGIQAGGPSEDVWSNPATLSYYDEPTGETQVGPQTNSASDNNSNLTVDFGFFQLGAITDTVWHDVNRDGLRTADEAPIAGVTVKLLNSVGEVVATTVSAADGTYRFSDLVPGTYSVVFVIATLPPGFVPTTPGAADPSKNSDADQVTGASGPVVVGPGTTVLDVALGARLSKSDLRIIKTAPGVTSARTGGTATWHLVIDNVSGDPAAGPITVTDTLPASLAFVSATGDFGCSAVGQDVTCTIAGLVPVGKTLVADITTKVVGGTGPVTNKASVAGAGTDTVVDNNVSSATVARSGRLPITGASLAGLLALAALLFGFGSILVIRSRRSTVR